MDQIKFLQYARQFDLSKNKSVSLALGVGATLLISGVATLPAIAVAGATAASAGVVLALWSEYKRTKAVVSEKQLSDHWSLMTAHVSEQNAQKRWDNIMEGLPVDDPYARRAAQSIVDEDNATHRKESFVLFQDAIDAVKRHIDQSGGSVGPLHVAKMLQLRDIIEQRKYIERGGGFPWRVYFAQAVEVHDLRNGRLPKKLDAAPDKYFFETVDNFCIENYAKMAETSLAIAMAPTTSNKIADLITAVENIKNAALIDNHLGKYLPGESSSLDDVFSTKANLVEKLENLKEAGMKSIEAVMDTTKGKWEAKFFEVTQDAVSQISDYERYLPSQLTANSVEMEWLNVVDKNKEHLTLQVAEQNGNAQRAESKRIHSFYNKLQDHVHKHGMTTTAIKYSDAFHTELEILLNSEQYRDELQKNPHAVHRHDAIRVTRNLLAERLQEHAPKRAIEATKKLQNIKIDAGNYMQFMEIAECIVEAGVAQKAASPFMSDEKIVANVTVIENNVKTLRAAFYLGLDDTTWDSTRKTLSGQSIADESHRVMGLVEQTLEEMKKCITTPLLTPSAESKQLESISF